MNQLLLCTCYHSTLFNIFLEMSTLQELADVLTHFLPTRAKLGGSARIIDSPDQLSVLQKLPNFFSQLLAKNGRLQEFVVKGSIGKGNIARVPWVGIFNKTITTSAEEGFYIVLLFSEDMSGCFLSLNQGVTEMGQRYTRRLAIKKMIEAAVFSRVHLEKHPEALYGEIDLHSTLDLGRGYEAGAIESFYYPRTALPTEKDLEAHFFALLSNYDKLYKAVGADLQGIAPITEAEYQDVVLEKASAAKPLDLPSNQDGGFPVPMLKVTGGKLAYVRNPSVAARALQDAGFVCELDAEHWTFESRASSRPYVEAHHLVPMSKQHLFDVSLDVTANIVCLCATCHRLLHFGKPTARNTSIKKLYKVRSKVLSAREIKVKANELLNYYSRDLAIEE